MFTKLFTAQQIKEIDRQTMIRQNISSEALMERAAKRLYLPLLYEMNKHISVYIFCGKGNNGGDALVLARLLHKNNYPFRCYSVEFTPKSSPDYAVNYQKLQDLGVEVFPVRDEKDLPEIPEKVLILDGIFGTGLSRSASGIAQAVIEHINQSAHKVISIDVPSGLYVDKSNEPKDSIIQADKVLTFQFPKISFFYPENARYVKDFEVVDIGLEQSVIKAMPARHFLLTGKVLRMIKKRSKFAYKNVFGHALIVGGSYGMTGAPVLSSKAALRIGAGLVTNLLPECGYTISQTAVPEVMTLTAGKKKHIDRIEVPAKINAVGIGMGLGQHPDTQKALKNFLKSYQKPLLLDADALNILAKHKNWWKYLPDNSVLTPHEGEFKRLVGEWKNDTEKWEKLKQFADDISSVVVLKGAYTVISDGKYFYINPVANPALATAGSGDVLSGMITGLLAQGYQSLEAALLSVYIHSQTAEKFVKEYPEYAMIATDIIEELKY